MLRLEYGFLDKAKAGGGHCICEGSRLFDQAGLDVLITMAWNSESAGKLALISYSQKGAGERVVENLAAPNGRAPRQRRRAGRKSGEKVANEIVR